MSTVFLVRHGRTELSRADYFCGTTDPPLDESGREMAEAIGARASCQKWAAVYASPLLRARQTAEVIADKIGLPVHIEPDLRELAYGEWEARRSAHVRRDDAERYRQWAASPGTVKPPGGETGESVAARAVPVVEAIARRHAGSAVIVVSHKTTIRLVICSLLGLDLGLYRARIAAPLASIAMVEFRESGPFLRLLGDTSHLPAHLRED